MSAAAITTTTAAPIAAWVETGLDTVCELRIERGPWTITRTLAGDRLRYALHRAGVFIDHFPDAHEAALHADGVDAAPAPI